MLGMVVFVAYGAYFMCVNQVTGENGLPLSNGERTFFVVAISIIGLSWLISFITMLRQAVMGCAFEIDAQGIRKTASTMTFLAFVFVVPIRTIPYNAIKSVSDKGGMLTLSIDKAKLDVSPLLRAFIRSEYSFFRGFTTANTEDIKYALDRYMKRESVDYQQEGL